jgi:hypothetical protein
MRLRRTLGLLWYRVPVYLLTLRMSFPATILSSIGPSLYASNDWVNDIVTRDQLATTMSANWAAAIGLPQANMLLLSVVDLNNTYQEPGKVVAQFKFAKQCNTRQYHYYSRKSANNGQTRLDRDFPSSLLGASQMSLHALAVDQPRYSNFSFGLLQAPYSVTGWPLANPNEDLLSLWSVLAFLLGDLSSPAYTGLLTAFVDPTYPITIYDPSGRTYPHNPNTPVDPFNLAASSHAAAAATATRSSERSTLSSGNSVPIIAGVVGGVAMFLCCVAVAVRTVITRRSIRNSYDEGVAGDNNDDDDVSMKGYGMGFWEGFFGKGKWVSRHALAAQKTQISGTAAESTYPSHLTVSASSTNDVEQIDVVVLAATQKLSQKNDLDAAEMGMIFGTSNSFATTYHQQSTTSVQSTLPALNMRKQLPPPGLPRGSIIQHVRLAPKQRASAAAAAAAAASTTKIQNLALIQLEANKTTGL